MWVCGAMALLEYDTFLKFAMTVFIKWAASVYRLFYIFIENYKHVSEYAAIT
jgi:hypothetical protein